MNRRVALGMNWQVLLAAVYCALIGLGSSAAMAVQPDEVLNDPQLETRARALSAELRCLVCQNQSIDDSDAPLARDLRLLVRERLRIGETDSQITQFLVDRYGDFVLLRPPLSVKTYALWIAPFVILLVGAFMTRRAVRAGSIASCASATADLTAVERERLREVLDQSTRQQSGQT